MGKVTFYDTVEFKSVGELPAKDFYTSPGAEKPLRVKIAATHAGRITRNKGFYLPNKMKEGTGSFLIPFAKPILVHHDAGGEPIGRVVSARYVDISQGLVPATSQSLGKDAVIEVPDWVNRLVSKDTTEEEAINIVRDFALKDSRMSDPTYEGLGYIELIADISDPVAIAKFLDKRYLTVSTGATTDSAICSTCKKDWAEEGKCEHEPGQIYDDAMCVLIAGNLFYDECSVVNKPADPQAMVIEVNVQGVMDSVRSNDNTIETSTITVVDQEEQKMTFKQAFEIASKDDKYKVIPKLEDWVKNFVDTHKEIEDEVFMSELVRVLDEEVTKLTPVVDETPVPDSKDPKVILGDSYDEIVGDDEWGIDYAKMIAECICGDLKGDNGESLENIKDAKLSSASRKKLASSTFCGPGRSYPVPDCGHAKSAMAYAKKNNAGSSVIACVRLCVVLGGRRIIKKKKETTTDKVQVGIFVLDYFDQFEDEQLAQMLLGLQDAIKERNLKCGCDSLVDSKKTEELEALFQAKQAEVEDSKTKTLAEMQSKLDSSRTECKYLLQDVDNLLDSLANASASVKETQIKHIEDLGKLNGTEIKVEDFVGKTQKEVQAVLDELTHKVDIQKIIDTLSSGLTNRLPEGTVVDPTLLQDNSKQKNTIESVLGEPRVRENALRIRIQYGDEAADKYLKDYLAAKNEIDSQKE